MDEKIKSKNQKIKKSKNPTYDIELTGENPLYYDTGP
jgi:hypothetical protein